MQTKYKVAIIGATGLVGRTVLKILEEKNLYKLYYNLFASKKSAGSKIKFFNRNYTIQELNEHSFDSHFDFAIFCAGGSISEKYIPIAVSKKCIVIDNSSIYRMNPNVPLVVPEVNPEDLFNHNGIISNPNCSTIQAVLPLKPINDKYKIKRIIYSTYQAVSGAGSKGIHDLDNGIKYYFNTENKEEDFFDIENKTEQKYALEKFPYPIFNNCLPHIDKFMENGYTKEEEKMINETRKILNRPELPITATTVRVPVFNCHCECINIEFEKDFELHDIINVLEKSPGIIVQDNPEENFYAIPSFVSGSNEVFVSRIRRDFSVKNGINLWVVADNIRKGAASNAVQILEKLI